jgi:hypothetical protein
MADDVQPAPLLVVGVGDPPVRPFGFVAASSRPGRVSTRTTGRTTSGPCPIASQIILESSIETGGRSSWTPWYPLWSIVMITVGAFVIWVLTVHGRYITVER